MLIAALSASLSMVKTTVVVISSILHSSVTFEKGKELCVDHLLREINFVIYVTIREVAMIVINGNW